MQTILIEFRDGRHALGLWDCGDVFLREGGLLAKETETTLEASLLRASDDSWRARVQIEPVTLERPVCFTVQLSHDQHAALQAAAALAGQSVQEYARLCVLSRTPSQDPNQAPKVAPRLAGGAG